MWNFGWSSSTWTPFLFLSVLLNLFESSLAQYGTSSNSGDAASANAAGAAGTGDSFISTQARDIIIVLSVVVGIVVIFGGASAVLYLVAKRRQWAVRAAIRRSARRVAESIKSPFTPKFPKSLRDAPPPRARSRQGMTRIEELRPEAKNRDSKSRDFASFNPTLKSERGKREYKRDRDLDLEQGIELGSTKTTTVRVSTKDSKASDDSSQRGWGTFFSFGRK